MQSNFTHTFEGKSSRQSCTKGFPLREREREREIYILPWSQVHVTGPRHHLTSSLRVRAQGDSVGISAWSSTRTETIMFVGARYKHVGIQYTRDVTMGDTVSRTISAP